MKKSKIRIYIDMDGVVCNFNKAVLTLYGVNEMPDPWPKGKRVHEVLGVEKHDVMERIFSEGGFLFWVGLEPYPWYEELLTVCNEFGKPAFISNQRRSAKILSGKVAWINQHRLPDFWLGYIFCNLKCQAASPNSILIDDSIRDCREFAEHGGQAVLFPQPWNTNADKCDDRIGYVKAELKQKTKALLLA